MHWLLQSSRLHGIQPRNLSREVVADYVVPTPIRTTMALTDATTDFFNAETRVRRAGARQVTGMTTDRLRLYTVFHLNMAYSSIEEEQRADVIRRCYWPLLRLATEHGVPVGLDASGYTLETVAALDPLWVAALREEVAAGRCELVGTGYAQLIGPLVPAAVNAANLRTGNEVYERLLGIRPAIALVNEQAWAAGLVHHYLDAGFHAVVSEWDNPARAHPEWPAEWRYLPQLACGAAGEAIPVIWNKSVAFQKFQRYAQGEMELDAYRDYLLSHLGATPRAFPLYGNDAEVFDFRPGRYDTEAAIHPGGEWRRIAALVTALQADPRVRLVLPSQVLELAGALGAGNRVRLESPEQPVPVKKHGKYNVTRWAVTGRDDVGINTACWRIAGALQADPHATDADWKELCYLWGSDFRTHITERRWRAFRDRLAAAEARLRRPESARPAAPLPATLLRPDVRTVRDGSTLAVDTPAVRARLNCRRGLAVEAISFPTVAETALCGTLHHGFFDDIAWSADFYTGHLVLEAPGRPKVTDLNPVEPSVELIGGGAQVLIRGTVPTPLGPVEKTLEIGVDTPRVAIRYRLAWDRIPVGSLRLGHVTLIPAAFDAETLFYRTCNGGDEAETFPLHGRVVDHGAAVSFLVSASQAIGMTSGWVELGDHHRVVRVEVDHEVAALVGMVTHRAVPPSYFCRLTLSAGEVDETRGEAPAAGPLTCSLTITARRHD